MKSRTEAEETLDLGLLVLGIEIQVKPILIQVTFGREIQPPVGTSTFGVLENDPPSVWGILGKMVERLLPETHHSREVVAIDDDGADSHGTAPVHAPRLEFPVPDNPSPLTESPAIVTLSQRLKRLGGPCLLVEKFDKAELRQRLTPLQYEVSVNKGTERPFSGEYWDNHEPGVYVCVVCGRGLFASETRFDSGTGWPSFWAPVQKESVEEERRVGKECRSRWSPYH